MAGKGKKIVIAEDDKFISEMYAMKLFQEGFNVECAYDGQEAIEKISEIRPDVVLLDIFMPGMDGIEVLNKIRSNEELKDIPVIVLTNANEKDHAEKAMEMGASDYLVKSNYTPDEVVSKINENI